MHCTTLGRWVAGTLLLLLMLVGSARAAAPVAPRVERPEGEYARWTLTLPGAMADKGRPSDVLLYVWTRGGAARQAMAVSPTDAFRDFRDADLSGLKEAGGRLTGAIRFAAHAQAVTDSNWPDVHWQIDLDVSAAGQAADGTFSGTCAVAAAPRDKEKPLADLLRQWADAQKSAAVAVRGRATGTRHSGDAYRRLEAVAGGPAWTRWLGSDGTMSGPSSGRDLLTDLRRARLVWRCEQALGPGKGQVTRYGDFGTWYRMPSYGGSSPVVSDGRLYLYYYVPSGDAYIKEEEQKRGPRGYFMRDMWLLGADDVVICLDAATGQTLWRTTYPAGGRTFLTGKSNLVNSTVAVADGTVVAVGGLGRVYALDAATGEQRWQATLGPEHEAAVKELAAGQPAGGRAFGHAITIADGVAAVDDERGGLLGLDLKTGQRRWLVAKVLGRFVTPQVWTCGGKSHFVTLSDGVVRCIEAATGKEIWQIDRLGTRKWGDCTPYLQGDHLVVNLTPEDQAQKDGKTAIHQAGCFKLALQGATKVWDLPVAEYPYPVHPSGHGGFMRVDDRHIGFVLGKRPADDKRQPILVVVELATGRVIHTLMNDPPVVTWNAPTIHRADNLALAVRDNWHDQMDWYVFTVRGPRDIALATTGGTQRFPHQPTTSYEVPLVSPIVDGRIFVRGGEGIYCYDLRRP